MESNQPLRRSARAASQKPEEPKAAAIKAAIAKTSTAKGDKTTKPLGRTSSRSNKRAASPDSPPQPAKRARSRAAKSDTEESTKLPSKKTQATTTAKRPTTNGLAPIQEQKPYFNLLPTPIDHPRPHANQLFCWGAGNFGQLGWGPRHLGEFNVPKRNLWFEKKKEEGVFGGIGAGLEAIAAGGLHTLFLDEKGTVSSISVRPNPTSADMISFGKVWSCGVNDDAALGRITNDVPDPDNPGKFLDVDNLTAIPHPLQSLVDEKFRAVRIAAGDNISAAISDQGELRVWGSFRVRTLFSIAHIP